MNIAEQLNLKTFFQKYRAINLGLISLLLIAGSIAAWSARADVYTFSQSAADGFGDAQNSLNVNDHAVIEFKGELYVTMENTGSGGQIWRTDTGSIGDWEQVVSDGFGDPNNFGIGALVVKGGYIYAGTVNNTDGAEVWRSDTGNDGDWEAVVADEVDGNGTGLDENGFGQGLNGSGDPKVQGIGSGVAGTSILFGTLGNARVFRSGDGVTWKIGSNESMGMGVDEDVDIRDMAVGGGFIYAALSDPTGAGARVYRCEYDDCETGADWSLITNPGLDDPQGIVPAINKIQIFNSKVYIGTEQTAAGDGAAVWRCTNSLSACQNQSDWEQVISGAFGDIENTSVTGMFSYAGHLYVGTTNSTNGAELNRSTDGESFEEVGDDGLGDANRTRIRGIAAFGNVLHVFTDELSKIVPLRQSLQPNLRPEVLVGSSKKDGSGKVAMNLRLDDIDDTVTGQVRVEYSIDGGETFNKATLSTVDAETSATYGDPKVNNTQYYQIGTSAGYVTTASGHNGVLAHWLSKTDVPNKNINNVVFRFTPYDGYSAGTALTSNEFEIDDVDPVISQATVSPNAGKMGDSITIQFSVNEGLDENPDVTLAGSAAEFVQSEGVGGGLTRYLYRYVLTGNETEGEIEVGSSARDDFQNTGVTSIDFTTDFTPPVTAPSPGVGTYKTAQSVVLQANDDASGASILGTGVDTIYYTTDGSNPTTASAQYVGPIATTDNGQTTIKYFSVDNVGNEEAVRTSVYTITPDAPAEGNLDDSFVIGTVFSDINADAAKSGTEPGLGNVRVRLYRDENDNRIFDDPDVLHATSFTASNGSFAFGGLPQDRYIIHVDESTISDGAILTTGNNPGVLALLDPGQGFTVAFGYQIPSSAIDPISDPAPVDGTPDDGGTLDPVDSTSDVPNNSDRRPIGAIGGETTTESSDEESDRPSILDRIREAIPPALGGTRQEEDQKRRDAVGEQSLVEMLVEQTRRATRNTATSLLAPMSALALVVGAVNFGLVGQGLWSYVRYLWQIITEPFRLLGAKKSRRWGVIYDLHTRQPIDLAIVRLFSHETGKLLQTSVTDRNGRYLFLVRETGELRIQVQKKGYIFPAVIDHAREFGVYRGEPFRVVPKQHAQEDSMESVQQVASSELVRIDIPLTREEGIVEIPGARKPVKLVLTTIKAFAEATDELRQAENAKIRAAATGRLAARWISYVGPLVALVSFILEPTILTGSLVVLHILLLLLFIRLALLRTGDPWGTVKDINANKELPRAIVRLFDKKYGKLLMAKVTAGDGRYAFLVGEGAYVLNASKQSYVFPEGVKEVMGGAHEEVNENLGMRRILGDAQVHEPTMRHDQ